MTSLCSLQPTTTPDNTAKPLMSVCPLFPEFYELNRKIEGREYRYYIPSLNGISRVLELCGLNSAKQKAPK